MAGAAFTGTAKLVFASIRLAAKYLPSFATAFGSLISAFETKAASSATPLSLGDFKTIAAEHGHELDHVAAEASHVIEKHAA